ncbi:putative membrane protein [Campylobacter ureolyticus RIGS 9880]|uniref:Membrane protein n=1 Tax=Campylobacter ureolyticus RIGS 9880 TaxID=1032069 RepID=A0AAU8TZ98_9BACT|nr:hypothetical protein [Campylobacter ureolyticus]AKT90850.1 putative membrane protein [Campylobacter ureolyticus RIGS 9880]
MSDDKREKLREYLRNNRPKNSVNLGNNSNNKENSNKNLENDLNLDNSQISNNKINLNKRDYDKEPIVIENNVILVNFIALIIGIFFIIAIFLFFKLHETTNSSFGSFSGLVAILVAFLNRQSSKIIFKNKSIKFIDTDHEKEIKINKYLKIFQTSDTRTNFLEKDEYLFSIVMIIVIFWAFITILIDGIKGFLFVVFFICMIYTILFLPSLIFQTLKNKSIKNVKFYGNILVWTFKYGNKDEYINMLPNYAQRIEIREYFLEKIGIDIDKTLKIRNIFKI